MKLKLILSAGLGLAAMEAPAKSSLTIAGYADGSVLYESGGARGSLKKVVSGMSAPTRLAVRGTEDLGDGMAAFFSIESSVLYDTGGSLQQNFWGREALVGLKGRAGALRLGLQYTALFKTLRDVGDPFRLAYTANAGNLLTAGVPGGPKSVGFPNPTASSGTVSAAGSNRANTVQYLSPVVGGFSGDVAYSLGEQDDSAKLHTIGASVGYSAGPANARLAYLHTQNTEGTDHHRNFVLAANYDFGPAKLYLTAGANRGYAGVKSTDLLLGAIVPIGLGNLMASYLRKNDQSANNNDARQYGLGYAYSLSKRTVLHASAARLKNSVPNTSPLFYTIAPSSGPGTGDKAIAAGIGHLF